MKKKQTQLIVRTLIVGLIVISTLIYFISICWNGLSRTYVEDGWKITQGTILSPDKKLLDKRSTDRANEGVEQTISYEYTVNSDRYESNSVSKETFVKVDSYPEGKIVDVFYNPKDSSDSVLIRSNVQTQYLYGMISFCVLSLIGSMFFLIKDIKYAIYNE